MIDTNNNAKIKILHVDDEFDTLSVVKTVLEKEGYLVKSVSNGRDAIKEIETNGYSLIILDIMMPDMSGWDLFTRISEIKPDYKIAFLSIVDVNEERLKDLKEAGIKDYIKKPFDNNDLVLRVQKILES